MIGVEDIAAWRGQQVIDADGEQLGKVDDVLFDSGSGTPLLLTVKSGLLGRHATLIPLDGATVGRDYVRVVHAKQTVEQAGVRAGDDVPDAQTLNAIGDAYGLRFAERVTLESASQRDSNRAEAEAARSRADSLEAEAARKLAAHQEATQRASTAGEDAGRAEREAAEARQAAEQARQEANRFDSP